jgi:hypothetical protein
MLRRGAGIPYSRRVALIVAAHGSEPQRLFATAQASSVEVENLLPSVVRDDNLRLWGRSRGPIERSSGQERLENMT